MHSPLLEVIFGWAFAAIALLFIIGGGRISRNMPPNRAGAWMSGRAAFAVVGVASGLLAAFLIGTAYGSWGTR